MTSASAASPAWTSAPVARCATSGPSQAHAPNEVTYKDDLVTAAAMYVAALNLYDPSQADGDATVFRAGLTNNKID